MGPAHRFRFSRLTIAASLCVALVAAGCASAVPGPSSAKPQAETLVPSPSSTKPQGETFVSDRYGFSITLPTGSVPRHATVDWDASCLCGLDDPAWDAASFAGGRVLVVGATAVDAAMDLAQWRARMVELAPSICHESAAATEATLGGEHALAWTAACSDGYNVIKLAALHGGRGYVVLFASPPSDGLADNQTAFDSIMSSFAYVGS
jgi:hypothetical protein